MGAVAVASPKKKPKKKADFATINVKASWEWKGWVDALAKHCRTDVAKLIDRALIDLAKKEGYDKEAPQR